MRSVIMARTGITGMAPGERDQRFLGLVTGRKSRPRALPATVRAATTSQAAASSAKSATEVPRSASEWVRTASEIVPVTQVPTGKVKLHQVSPNGSPCRAVRIVTAVARASHSIANPQAGTP